MTAARKRTIQALAERVALLRWRVSYSSWIFELERNKAQAPSLGLDGAPMSSGARVDDGKVDRRAERDVQFSGRSTFVGEG